jgi:hypothetical protein
MYGEEKVAAKVFTLPFRESKYENEKSCVNILIRAPHKNIVRHPHIILLA